MELKISVLWSLCQELSSSCLPLIRTIHGRPPSASVAICPSQVTASSVPVIFVCVRSPPMTLHHLTLLRLSDPVDRRDLTVVHIGHTLAMLALPPIHQGFSNWGVFTPWRCEVWVLGGGGGHTLMNRKNILLMQITSSMSDPRSFENPRYTLTTCFAPGSNRPPTKKNRFLLL